MKTGRLSVVTAALLAAWFTSGDVAAQPAKRPYRIGVLHGAFAPNPPWVEGLKVGLKELGLDEGRDVTFSIRFTEGNLGALSEAATTLVKEGPDLIFTTGEYATRAAKAATQKIPIVFSSVGDPVSAGIVAEVAHPGGNVTGGSSLVTELAPKRLEILKAVVPTLRRVWAIYHADEAEVLAAVRKAQEAAPRLKLELVARPVRTPEELARALKAVRAGDGFLPPVSASLAIPAEILETSLSVRAPAIYSAAFWIGYGALVSYGSDFYAEGRQAARLVAKILRGARPQDLPVEGANKIELVINLKTAKALGLTIPQAVLIRADEVIQ